MGAITIQVRRKGTITLPRELRRRYRLDEGDILTVVDLGDGSLLLTPGVSQVAQLGDKVGRLLADAHVTVDMLLEALDEEREAYYRQHYVHTPPVSGQ